MSARKQLFIFAFAIAVLGIGLTTPAHAQGKGKGKHYSVSSDKAMSVTRDVLQRQGYEVVRVVHAEAEDAHVVYYRRGSNGRGKGKGPVERLVIRTVERRVVFEEATPAILVDIDFHLKL
jgi:hypothetical protein